MDSRNKCLPLCMASLGLMLAAPALAVDPLNQSIINKRQVVGCMVKRMRSNRTLSYLDAKKTCVAELSGQDASMASSSSPGRERPPTAAAGPGS